MTSFRPAPAWLADAVFTGTDPQSFADSNGDGIGDFNGIAERLDHLAWLGVNTVLANPCFVSPFRDAGYDVSDYLTVAPRYRLPRRPGQAGRRGGPGAASGSCWRPRGRAHLRRAPVVQGRRARSDRRPEPSGRPRAVLIGFVPSPGTRPATTCRNFFAFQPALNFGYARANPAEPWRLPVDAEGPRANRAALRTIMDHWLQAPACPASVDMAASLVKDDPDRTETAKVWAELRHWLDDAHPDAVLLSEWG